MDETETVDAAVEPVEKEKPVDRYTEISEAFNYLKQELTAVMESGEVSFIASHARQLSVIVSKLEYHVEILNSMRGGYLVYASKVDELEQKLWKLQAAVAGAPVAPVAPTLPASAPGASSEAAPITSSVSFNHIEPAPKGPDVV